MTEPEILATIGRVSAGEDLSLAAMTSVVDSIMSGHWNDQQIGLLLNALRAKGETVEEIAGAAAAMRRHMTPIRSARTGVIDTCGTGGDGSGTFNISTAAALVTAAAGVPVAKHGNRGISSKSGSANVLAELGVNIEASVATVERCLEELGICFCFAPSLHPAMKHVAAARKALGVPTIFNLLGPLCNPAGAQFQLLGVGKPELRAKLAAALGLLQAQRAVVVCGDDGLDEVTLGGTTQATLVEGSQANSFVWHPADFGLAVADRSTMLIDGPVDSARIIRGILAGAVGPSRDIVVLNAAAALWTAQVSAEPRECARRAAAAIDSGAAARLLERLVATSHGRTDHERGNHPA